MLTSQKIIDLKRQRYVESSWILSIRRIRYKQISYLTEATCFAGAAIEEPRGRVLARIRVSYFRGRRELRSGITTRNWNYPRITIGRVYSRVRGCVLIYGTAARNGSSALTARKHAAAAAAASVHGSPSFLRSKARRSRRRCRSLLARLLFNFPFSTFRFTRAWRKTSIYVEFAAADG